MGKARHQTVVLDAGALRAAEEPVKRPGLAPHTER
jgi:hypothetical protein